MGNPLPIWKGLLGTTVAHSANSIPGPVCKGLCRREEWSLRYPTICLNEKIQSEESIPHSLVNRLLLAKDEFDWRVHQSSQFIGFCKGARPANLDRGVTQNFPSKWANFTTGNPPAEHGKAGAARPYFLTRSE